MTSSEQMDPTVGGTEATAEQSGPAQAIAEGKGKEKAPAPVDTSMDEDDSDEDEDDSAAEGAEPEVEEEDEDNMEEIDTSNIVGSRTRGKTIDYEAANKAEDLPESDDEDEDFEGDEDAMQE